MESITGNLTIARRLALVFGIVIVTFVVTAAVSLRSAARLAEADHNERGRFGGKQVPGDEPW